MRVLAVLAVVVLAAAPRPSWAYECKVSEAYSYVSLSWRERTIPYGVRAGSRTLDATTALRSIERSFATWTEPDCTDLSFSSEGVVGVERTDVAQVVFVQEGWEHAPNAVGLTRTTYGVLDGVIRTATIELNEDLYTFRDVVADGCPDTVPRPYDITAVVTHEVGHLIGLDHTRRWDGLPTDPTMAPEIAACEVEKRTLEDDDLDGLCLLYPKGEPPGQCVELPATSGTYVSNTPFGCSAASPGPGHPTAREGRSTPGVLLAAVALLWARTRGRRSRWNAGPKTCPAIRSGR